MSIAFESPEVQLQKLRERLRKMSAARVSPLPDPCEAPQLEAARAEWRRRHPKHRRSAENP